MLNSAQRLGQKGEKLAIKYLKKSGYKIICTNYRCPAGELDIVAQHQEYLVFVEVKTRSSRQFGTPFDAVDFRKQRQISRAGEYYLIEKEIGECDIRFDVIAILIEEKRVPQVEHIRNAFEFLV